jgi:hypothetical protein
MDDFLSHFRRNPDGSWTCVEPATFEGPNGPIRVPEGRTFAIGSRFMGTDLAAWLDELLQKVLNPPKH